MTQRYEGGAVLAEVVRSGFVEGFHRGSVVVLDAAGTVVAAAGDIESPIFPRSSNKPMQAVGLLRAGWVPGSAADLALASASHLGEPFHVDRVRSMLAAGGLDETALQCPPSLPIDPDASAAVLAAGGTASRVLMNCSGKHAGMLLTCLAAGWPLESYLEPGHPLQKMLRETVAELTRSDIAATGVDGCGAPLFALPLHGLASAFLRLVQAPAGSERAPAGSPERAVADAMRAHPELVAGTHGADTRLMAGVPGLLAKIGAEGVQAIAVPEVGAVAVKIDDGNVRATVPVAVAALRTLGVEAPVLTELAESPLLGGGKPVGSVRVVADFTHTVC